MHAPRLEWTTFASQLDGAGFARFQRELTKFNRRRLEPSLPEPGWRGDVGEQCRVLEAEGAFVEAVRAKIAPLVAGIPQDVDGFLAWFERLRETGPGQGDALFPWLAARATLPQMIWFIEQEVAGEAGFEDLLAFTQVKMPEQAKLEMARNYWDEMGRGASKGMHGPMLERLAHYLDVHPTAEFGNSRSAGPGQYDGGPGAQSPLRLPLDRCARRHRDDGPDPGRLRRPRLAPPGAPGEETALFRPARRPRREAFGRPGIAKSCGLWSPRIRAARKPSAKARCFGFGTAPAASSATGRNSTSRRSRARLPSHVPCRTADQCAFSELATTAISARSTFD